MERELLIPIDDGYTLDDEIPAGRTWPAVKIRYRQALHREVREYFRFTRELGKSDASIRIKMVADHLKGWDVHSKGELVPITSEVLERVPAPVLDRMLDIITGYAPADQEADAKN